MINPELQEVVDVMLRLDGEPTERLAQETVRRWMRSNDLQVLGAVYYLLFDRRYFSKIEPAFTLDDYKEFVLPYYERCLREDPQTDWSSPRYTAGWDLVGWFMSLWRDDTVPRAALAEIKSWLEQIYISADDELRTCLVTATLEHLFEDRKVAKFFSDWHKHPVLHDAYREGMNWSAEGRSSPLGKSR